MNKLLAVFFIYNLIYTSVTISRAA